jgi:hypothetical protein
MYYRFNENSPMVDWDGDGDRDYMIDEHNIDLKRLYFYRGTWLGGPEGAYHVSGFLSDTMTWGRLTIKLGLRYDRQQCYSQVKNAERS